MAGMFCEIHNVQDNNLTLQSSTKVVHICREVMVNWPSGNFKGELMMQTFDSLCGTFSQLTNAQGYGSIWPKSNHYRKLCKRCVKSHS